MYKSKINGYVKFNNQLYRNTITTGMLTYVGKHMCGTYKPEINYVYFQYGDTAYFPEGEESSVVPSFSDTVSTLKLEHVTISKCPIIIRSTTSTGAYTDNQADFVGYLNDSACDDKSIIGAGLVYKENNNELLVAHVAINNVVKRSQIDKGIIWSIEFVVESES